MRKIYPFQKIYKFNRPKKLGLPYDNAYKVPVNGLCSTEFVFVDTRHFHFFHQHLLN